MNLEIYTDGGCRGNPGIGAWAICAYLKDNIKHKRSSGSIETTNNIMELTAAIEAAKLYAENYKEEYKTATIKTDSKYTIDCVKTWIHNWRKNNWLTANKSPVKNAALIKELEALLTEHSIKIEWVKGHAGVEGNEICDTTLNQTMDIIQSSKTIPTMNEII